MKLHANAPLGPKGRAVMVRRVTEEQRSQVVRRYRSEGEAGLFDRCSAPLTVANRSDEARIEAIAALRRLRMTGAEIAEILGMALSTVSGILQRIGFGKLGALEPPEPPNRYERARPGERRWRKW